jgi:polysaccharide pyruvyl transferase WcaK-like protein
MIFNKNKKIVISAAYGMGNIGDEAICSTLVNDIFYINNKVKITILAKDKNIFLQSHPDFVDDKRIKVQQSFFLQSFLKEPKKLFNTFLSLLYIVNCDIFIWGGGGVIRDKVYWLKFYICPLFFAQFIGKKIFIASIGVNEIYNDEVKKIVRKIKKASFFSVRDKKSKNNLLNILKNQKIAVVRDPVFHFKDYYNEEESIHKNEIFVIGLNLAFIENSDLYKEIKSNEFAVSLSKILNAVYSKRKYEILYLPTDRDKDSILFEKVKKNLNSNIVIKSVESKNPSEYLDRLRTVNLLVSSRMHSFIMGSNIDYLPIISFVYDEKINVLRNELLGNKDNWFSVNNILHNKEDIENKIINCIDFPRNNLLGFNKFYDDSRTIITELSRYIKK